MPIGNSANARPKRFPISKDAAVGTQIDGDRGANRHARSALALCVQIAAEGAGERGDQDVVDRAAEHAADGSNLFERQRLAPRDALDAAQRLLQARRRVIRHADAEARELAGKAEHFARCRRGLEQDAA